MNALIDILIILLLAWGFMRYLGPILVTFVVTHPDAVPPKRAYGRPACFDLTAIESKPIPPGEWRTIETGIAYAPWPHIYIKRWNLTLTPFGNVAYKLYTRSGMAIKKGIRAHLGVIDNDYRETISVVLFNHNPKNSIYVKAGERVGQVEFYRVPSVWFFQVSELAPSQRGTKGMGSSGK